MKKPRVIILRTAGTNCDNETAFAFKMAGGEPELVHINELTRDEKFLKDYQILAIPGGFTYGDDIASGKILANEMKYKLHSDLKDFINTGKLIIGICNGFQALVKAGILPGINPDFAIEKSARRADRLNPIGFNLARRGNPKQISNAKFGINTGAIEATLSFNDSGSFIDKWVHLETPYHKGTAQAGEKGQETREKCIWTRGLKETIYLPIAHGEGKFIPRDKEILNSLKKNGQLVFKYTNNPNGSIDDIAGICDTTGRVLGMMPHPERHLIGTQHPRWTREGLKEFGDGFAIFKNGVDYIKEKS